MLTHKKKGGPAKQQPYTAHEYHLNEHVSFQYINDVFFIGLFYWFAVMATVLICDVRANVLQAQSTAMVSLLSKTGTHWRLIDICWDMEQNRIVPVKRGHMVTEPLFRPLLPVLVYKHGRGMDLVTQE